MGGLFDGGGLTNQNSALINQDGSVAKMGNPSQIRTEDFSSHAKLHPYLPGTPDPNAPIPQTGTPTFKQAAEYHATPGGMNATSPGLNKAGKLATLLTSGLQGALAGRAKSEETVAATGGHRSGGAGMGFEAGYTLPWQRASQQNQLAQQQAQTEALKAQSELVQTPNGPIPGWLAKSVLPATIRAGATTEAADTHAGAQRDVAGINQKFKAVPGVGLFDTTTRQVVPGTAQGITVTPEIAKDYQLPEDFIGKPMKLTDLTGLERAQNQQTTTVQGAEGPALVNKKTAQTTKLGLGNPSIASKMAGGVQVMDENDPGHIYYDTLGNALNKHLAAPSSAAAVAEKTAARSNVPTKMGDQKVAFNTMIQHADLLRKAARALNNNDSQTLSGLKNRFKNEFGYSGPITAAAIADAYKGEVSNVINKGHITDAGNEKIEHTLDPTKQNFQTIDSVLGAYQALAQSKMNELTKQEKASTGGRNAKPGGAEIHYKIVNGQLVKQ